MERKEILEQLKTTEADIKERLEQVQHKRNEIATQTQKQAHTLEEDNERKIKADQDTLFADAKKEIDAERSKALTKAKTDAEALKKKAQIQKAKDFFVKQFEEHVHV